MFRFLRTHPGCRRAIALFLALTHFGAIVEPTATWALTSGPAQPEFTSFEPVVTTDMVNEFTGDFTYNIPVLEIPGPDGSGYAMSLSYHSGTTPEEEASWVGSGWTLNPGAINRQMVGIPDDWKGQQMKYYNIAPENTTVSVSGAIQPELMSFDVMVGGDGTIRYNNYTGFGYSAGVGLQFCSGIISLGFHVTDGNGSFSLAVNPAAALNKRRDEMSQDIKKAKAELKNECLPQSKRSELETSINGLTAQLNASKQKAGRLNKLSSITRHASAYGMHGIEAGTFPMNGHNMTGESWTLGLGLNVTVAPIDLGVQGNVSGTLAKQRNDDLPVTLDTYGYLYQNSVEQGEDVMDYHTDNATTYNKRDKHLPQSYNDIDQFVATGEGIMGSMQLHADHPTTNRPAATLGSTDMNQIGIEVNLGVSLGMSFDTYVVGSQELIQGSWSSGYASNSPRSDEPLFFRMAGDKGGYMLNGNGTAPEQAAVILEGETPGYRTGRYEVPMSSQVMSMGGERSGRSSHIGYTTYADLNKYEDRWRYEKAAASSYVAELTPSGEAEPTPDQIAEISILNENGQRYNYALPVMVRKEKSMSFYHDGMDDHKYFHTAAENEAGSSFRTGSEMGAGTSYATSYLLTSILQSDHIDRLEDGATPDDIGGYTKFYYEETQPNFKWRSPYKGCRYSDPELSECYDNRAQYSSGEKEIKYLRRVETKSHVAIFSRSPRQDGLGAGLTGQLDKLDKIDLFLRSDIDGNGFPVAGAVPSRTVHFEYYAPTEGVWPGVPNHTQEPSGTKLTLKSVHFTSNGTNPARIAPYEFDYTYGDPDLGGHPAAFDLAPPANEEPPPLYSPFCTDPWGNYRNDGETRYEELKPWLDQGYDQTFDPAAWQLKKITLPSGGEIHVQYEQDDYAYVQDEKAHAMVPLKEGVFHNANTNVFEVDVTDLIGSSISGVAMPFDRDEIMQQLRQIYTDPSGPQRKIFYKIMYLFEGSEGECSNPNSRHREFMTGYSTVDGIEPVDGSTNSIKIILESNSRPQKICQQQFKAEKKGKSRDGVCGGSAILNDGPSTNGSALDDINGFYDNFRAYVGSGLEDNCDKICPTNSYFRVPVGERKLGGGIRVKRLLMVDPAAIDAGYPAVFGTEYLYKTTDDRGRVISSGVASNEPGSLREENVLIRPLDRYKQSFLSRMVAGRDRKQVEGPIGESVYPGPSVGYSKVIARSIHVGRSAPAFTVNQFHTFKDHPVRATMTDIDPENDYVPMTTGIINVVRNSLYASQGFTIHIPDMHGKPARRASYNGDHMALLNWNGVFANLISSVETDYFGEGEQLPIMSKPDGSVQVGMVGAYQPLGQEVNVCMETRQIRDRMNNGTVELDTDVSALLIPFPSVSAMVTVSHTLNKAATHTITKVARYPGIVKRTRTFKDGIYHVTQNIAFDRQTGNPTVVRSHDGFFPVADLQAANLNVAGEGIYTSVSVPGSMVYECLGQAAAGERKALYSVCGQPSSTLCIECFAASGTNATLKFTNPSLPEGEQASCGVPNGFCVGDRLLIKASNVDHYYHLSSIENNQLHLVRAGGSDYLSTSAPVAFVQILRSGCSNKLNESAGGFTYYGVQDAANVQEMQDRLAFVAKLNHALFMVAIGASPQWRIDGPPPVSLSYSIAPFCREYPPYEATIPNPPDHITFNTTPYSILSPGGVWDTGIQLTTTPINLTPPDAMCQKVDLEYPGQFALDQDGMLIYQVPNACPPQPFLCPQFCLPIPVIETITNVVASNVTTYDDNWDYATAEYANGPAWPGDRNDYELGKRGKWRPSSHYAYMSPLTPGTKNYDQGMYDMALFHYRDPALNDPTPWTLTDLITHYSPEGNILQQLDALGRPSAAKFGYDKMLPTLMAQNSVLSLVLFESFEKTYPTSPVALEDGVVFAPEWPATGRNGDTFHSGKHSYRTSAPLLFRSPLMEVPDISNTALFQNRTMLVKCWINARNTSGATEVSELNCEMSDPSTASQTTVEMERVARTGDWVQYSAMIPVWANANNIQFEITCANPLGTTTAIDDVRIQPVDAQMMTYVYDPNTLRLLTTFNDQHFGQFYQYDGEGKLVRKLIETERGMKTVQENLQNTPLRLQ